jgi:hypothetical protein
MEWVRRRHLHERSSINKSDQLAMHLHLHLHWSIPFAWLTARPRHMPTTWCVTSFLLFISPKFKLQRSPLSISWCMLKQNYIVWLCRHYWAPKRGRVWKPFPTSGAFSTEKWSSVEFTRGWILCGVHARKKSSGAIWERQLTHICGVKVIVFACMYFLGEFTEAVGACFFPFLP